MSGIKHSSYWFAYGIETFVKHGTNEFLVASENFGMTNLDFRYDKILVTSELFRFKKVILKSLATTTFLIFN